MEVLQKDINEGGSVILSSGSGTETSSGGMTIKTSDAEGSGASGDVVIKMAIQQTVIVEIL